VELIESEGQGSMYPTYSQRNSIIQTWWTFLKIVYSLYSKIMTYDQEICNYQWSAWIDSYCLGYTVNSQLLQK